MREEVISSGTVDPRVIARSSSPPPTPAASSAGASSPAAPTNVGSIDWFGSAQGSKAGSSGPSCRPWERGDLLRRLATFKPSNWCEKPKVASSLACARRGWMNIDIDKIECEVCSAHLTFTALSTWESVEAERAAEAFSEQLDAGHKVTCPWRGNYCADSLVQFPPTPPSALIGGYKDRGDGLLQFPSLPVISSCAIEKMRLSRSTQINRFLSHLQTYSSGDFDLRVDNTPGIEFSREDASCIYYHAQKLISLCGWEPRWLPNIQDYEENSTQSAKNACSIGPTGDKLFRYRHAGLSKNTYSASAIRDKGKKKMHIEEMKCNLRSSLLDCSLCGVTVNISDFLTVSRPARFALNNATDTPNKSKKIVLTRGISAASGINGWIAAEGVEKEQIEGRDEAPTNDEGKSLSNTVVDLNLTMAGGLPSTHPGMTVMADHFDDGGMGRDLIIGQPAGSQIGNRAASHESRGPSTRKRSFEDGGSTVDRPLDRFQQADSIEGTVIDRDCDEADGIQFSGGPSKHTRGLDIFGTYHSSRWIDSSGAGPSRNFVFDIDMDVNRVFKEGGDLAVGLPSARNSARASSVIAMDTIYHSSGEDSMDSVENYPGFGGADDAHFPSPSIGRSLDMNEALEINYSIQAQQSTCFQPVAAGGVAREIGTSSINKGEVVNAETITVHGRDRFSFGLSGGSVGMGASHEAEVHGIDASLQRAESTVGDAEPITEITENLGQTGESAPGPGLMDEFIPEEMDREDPHGDSQEMISRLVGKTDSGSKIYGPTKADSVESREKNSRALGRESSGHPSLSCNGVIISGYEASKGEVTQNGRMALPDGTIFNSACARENGTEEGENESELGEFDPIKHHNIYCPWVNGNVAAAGCSANGSSSSSSSVALCGWELTLDALDTFHSLGHIPNQTMQSESAASLYKDDHLTPSQKLLARHSMSKSKGQL